MKLDEELTPSERRREVARILATGILRLRGIHRCMGRVESANSPLSNSESGVLEESRKRPLSVNSG